jgi:hypothetical protein
MVKAKSNPITPLVGGDRYKKRRLFLLESKEMIT